MSFVEKQIQTNQDFACVYFDLDNFKAYNDYYGFCKGDEVIKNTARILICSLQQKGTPQDFIGHIGGDDFVVITTPEKVDELCKKIIADFTAMVPGLYNKEDLEKGYIIGKDRQKKIKKIPLLSISIGVVTNDKRKIEHVGEVGELGAELKEYAKSLPGSNYVKERREVT